MTRRDWWAGIAVLITVGAVACWFLPRHIASGVAAGAVDGATGAGVSIDEQVKEYRRNLDKKISKEKAVSVETDIDFDKHEVEDLILLYARAFRRYKLDVKKYPSNLDELIKSTAAGWDGPYMDKNPTDPWGHPYMYAVPGKHSAFDIWSCGPDGISGTADDFGNWNL